MAHQILAQGADPATMQPFSPGHGPVLVNCRRAEALGLADRIESEAEIIDEVIEVS